MHAINFMKDFKQFYLEHDSANETTSFFSLVQK